MVDSESTSFSDEKSSGKNSFIRVTNINIMLNTNILGMKPTPLTFDMLYHQDLEKGRYPTAQYSLPYFTDSVKYPMDYLSSKTYSERVDLFFNKKRFNTMCRQLGADYIDYEDEVADASVNSNNVDNLKSQKIIKSETLGVENNNKPVTNNTNNNVGKIANNIPNISYSKPAEVVRDRPKTRSMTRFKKTAPAIRNQQIFTGNNIITKRSSRGLSASYWSKIIGTRSKKEFKKNQAIQL